MFGHVRDHVSVLLLDCLSVSALFIFFKQKSAYEVHISDLSSDVCSSDPISIHRRRSRTGSSRRAPGWPAGPRWLTASASPPRSGRQAPLPADTRSEGRRVGKEGVSTGRNRGGPSH